MCFLLKTIHPPLCSLWISWFTGLLTSPEQGIYRHFTPSRAKKYRKITEDSGFSVKKPKEIKPHVISLLFLLETYEE